jgi:hypothetical protein
MTPLLFPLSSCYRLVTSSSYISSLFSFSLSLSLSWLFSFYHFIFFFLPYYVFISRSNHFRYQQSLLLYLFEYLLLPSFNWSPLSLSMPFPQVWSLSLCLFNFAFLCFADDVLFYFLLFCIQFWFDWYLDLVLICYSSDSIWGKLRFL